MLSCSPNREPVSLSLSSTTLPRHLSRQNDPGNALQPSEVPTASWNERRKRHDLYGDLVFPMRGVFLLAEPERDFTGGEFLLVEHHQEDCRGRKLYRFNKAMLSPLRSIIADRRACAVHRVSISAMASVACTPDTSTRSVSSSTTPNNETWSRWRRCFVREDRRTDVDEEICAAIASVELARDGMLLINNPKRQG